MRVLPLLGRQFVGLDGYEDQAVDVLHPGWVRTDMGGPSAPTTVQESASGIHRVIDGLSRAEIGTAYSQT